MMRYTQARQFLEGLYPELDLDSIGESEAKSHTKYAHDNWLAWSCLLAWIRCDKYTCPGCNWPTHCEDGPYCLTCDRIMLDTVQDAAYEAAEMEAEMGHDREED